MQTRAYRGRNCLLNRMIAHWQLYLFIFPALLYIVMFCYMPMYGSIIAFKNFNGRMGILHSPWAGLSHFRNFFSSYQFVLLLKNTLRISICSLVFGFPVPIILALMMNEIKSTDFKRFTQTAVYAPYFISTVVMVSMITLFLSSVGVINQIGNRLGFNTIDYLGNASYFTSIYVITGIWQSAGFGSVIYLAALSGVDLELHEAAVLDGASKLQRIWHINIPCLTPTIVILLIMNLGQVMNVGFEKVYLMQNPLNLSTSEIVNTYVYKRGLLQAQYSFSAAVGLFNSAINFLLLIAVNQIARKLNETSLW